MKRIILSIRKSGILPYFLAMPFMLVSFNQLQAQYCSANFSNVTFEYVTNVTFGTINNTTTGVTGLNDYTAMVTNAEIGTVMTLSVSISPDANDYVYAFIDWNQNGVLNDAGEVYTLAMATSSPGPHTMAINIPANAVEGNTRMRVMCDWANSAPDPCRSTTYGEVEDYTVNSFRPIVPDDAGIEALVSPSANCEGTYDIVARVKNYGSNPLTGCIIEWVKSGVSQTAVNFNQTLSPVGTSGSTADIVLGQITMTLSSSDSVKVWTTLPNGVADTSEWNDTVEKVLKDVKPVVVTFPYNEDFEAGQGDWSIGGTSSSWAFGTPGKSLINAASSGINAFVTGGLSTALYNANENSHVSSPCYDVSGFSGTPWIALDVNWDIEKDWDGAVVQVSDDGGESWNVVGEFNDPYNWYNNNNIGASPGNQSDGWSGTGTSSSNGWVRASHEVVTMYPLLQFRVLFASDGSAQEEGIAFDNFTIADFKEADLGPNRSMCNASNFTLDPNVNFTGNIMWSTNDSINETIQVSTPGQYWVSYTDSLLGVTTMDTVDLINSPPPTINFSASSYTIRENEDITLNPKTPFDLNYTWTPGNVTFPYLLVEGPVYGVGTHSFSLVVEDSVLCSDQATVEVVITSIVGTEELEASEMRIFPNPVQNILTIMVPNPQSDRTELRLYDLSGKMVYSNIYGLNGSSKIEMDMSTLKAGSYMLQIANGEQVVVRKVMKQ